jgi:predicted N-acyltransferase
MEIRFVQSLAEVDAAAWDALAGGADPFLSHGFLHGLELHDCLSPQGWYPCHAVAFDDDRLIGAMPLYAKNNSYGEFVFDWSWADAYERAGGRYYPKFVSAIPFTPVSGRRVLSAPQHQGVEGALVQAAIELVQKNDASSLHCLFPVETQADIFTEHDMLLRHSCQYHWFNYDYANFDAFLATLTSKRRKQIKRERRKAVESGVEIELLRGAEIGAEQWSCFYDFYCSTFYRKWGEPRFTESFFQSLPGLRIGEPLLVLGKYAGEYVAGAFALQGNDTLYGRHWGCSKHFKNLHFELCYYQLIEYCIEQKLHRFDAGVQGEHKIMRGFEPVKTLSAHWISDPALRAAVSRFVNNESSAISDYIDELDDHTAYRQADGGPTKPVSSAP